MIPDQAIAIAQKADLAAPTTDHLVARLHDRYRDRITGYFRIPAKPARFAEFPAGLSEPLRAALATRGVTALYSHQRESWDALEAGQNVVVVTPTASGKSLCYHLPVIEAVRSGQGKALYLFPTKALAQGAFKHLKTKYTNPPK